MGLAESVAAGSAEVALYVAMACTSRSVTPNALRRTFWTTRRNVTEYILRVYSVGFGAGIRTRVLRRMRPRQKPGPPTHTDSSSDPSPPPLRIHGDGALVNHPAEEGLGLRFG